MIYIIIILIINNIKKVACNYSGVISYELGEDNFDVLSFQQFLHNKVAVDLQPYPNTNSIILMDNASWHNHELIREFCEMYNVIVLYLPSYYPLLNLAEYIFLGICL